MKDLDIVCVLLSHQIDKSLGEETVIDRKVEKGRSTYDRYYLHLAAQASNLEVVKVPFNQRFKSGYSTKRLIIRAICSGHRDVAQWLINHYVLYREGTAHAEYYKHHHGSTGSIEERALQEACYHRDAAAVRAILAVPWTVKSPNFIEMGNATLESDWRHVSWATKQWNTIRDISPVDVCVHSGDLELLKILLDHGANPHGTPHFNKYGKLPLSRSP